MMVLQTSYSVFFLFCFFDKAIENGDVGGVRTWLERCKAEDSKFDINAVRDKRTEEIKILKATIQTKGMTPLHYAVLYGKLKIIELFLKNNAGGYNNCVLKFSMTHLHFD